MLADTANNGLAVAEDPFRMEERLDILICKRVRPQSALSRRLCHVDFEGPLEETPW